MPARSRRWHATTDSGVAGILTQTRDLRGQGWACVRRNARDAIATCLGMPSASKSWTSRSACATVLSASCAADGDVCTSTRPARYGYTALASSTAWGAGAHGQHRAEHAADADRSTDQDVAGISDLVLQIRPRLPRPIAGGGDEGSSVRPDCFRVHDRLVRGHVAERVGGRRVPRGDGGVHRVDVDGDRAADEVEEGGHGGRRGAMCGCEERAGEGDDDRAGMVRGWGELCGGCLRARASRRAHCPKQRCAASCARTTTPA